MLLFNLLRYNVITFIVFMHLHIIIFEKERNDIMYPLKLKPIYDKTIWANDNLTKLRGIKETGFGTIWEVSAHPYSKNEILNGEYAGKTLWDLLEDNPKAHFRRNSSFKNGSFSIS